MDSSAPANTQGSLIYQCSYSECTKSFRRREHLYRHIHGHENTRLHKCYICERSFSRKDILNRHVLKHNVPSESSKRTLIACETCRRKKVRCDSKYPCSACVSSQTSCVRQPSSGQAAGQGISHGADNQTHESEENAEGELENWSSDGEDEEREAYRVEADGLSFDAGEMNNFLFGPMWDVNGEVGTLHSQGIQHGITTSLNMHSPEPVFTRPYSSLAPSAVSSFFNKSSTVDLSSWTTESTAPQTSYNLSNVLSQDLVIPGHTINEKELPVQASIQLNELDIFFYREWPIVHFPTLKSSGVDKAYLNLVQALSLLSSWVQDRVEQNLSHQAVNELIVNELLLSKPIDLVGSAKTALNIEILHALQAVTLHMVQIGVSDSSGSSMEWVGRWSASIISVLRQREVLDGNWNITESFDSEDGLWLLEDQIKRIVLVLLRLDAYTSVLTGKAPNLRVQELRFPLPNSEAFWEAKDSCERTSLRWRATVGRSKQLMSSIFRQGKLKIGGKQIPIQLSLEDYHLALCSFQGHLWALSQDMRLHHQMTTSTTSCELFQKETHAWRCHLKDAREHMELNHNLEHIFFDNTDRNAPYPNFAAPNLTLYHIQSIGLYSNIRMLESHACCSECHGSELESRIRRWVQSEDGRHAVIHAAQLRRVYERDGILLTAAEWRVSNRMLRPLGLLLSAITICSYIVRVGKCSKCSTYNMENASATATPAIELLRSGVGASEAFLSNWAYSGGMATLGGVPLCSCSLRTHLEWYLTRIAAYPDYHGRFFKFMSVSLPDHSMAFFL